MPKPVARLASAMLGLSTLGLFACSSGQDDLAGDLEIGGTEPASWTVQVSHADNKSTIAILGEANFEGALPVKSSGEGGATLMTSKTDQGDFVMSFAHKECFDGLADVGRPWTVSVTWKGETFQGCGRPVETDSKPDAAKPASG